ncbi:hypothetical protein [Falsiroseomonas stagni]|uniref:Uncharacterized protein n=1 Tax=Falsiroseomonas stagni DSM 19981 TaxID=1123062 RepID=A0A1I4EMT0_9PROT|nr:hypothetical protein [Falsiroseomonas stagni]SFL06390.1 hypothetical protein SAMN02745775_11710 [Falsiroseomonas stagni DSM 19981]
MVVAAVILVALLLLPGVIAGLIARPLFITPIFTTPPMSTHDLRYVLNQHSAGLFDIVMRAVVAEFALGFLAGSVAVTLARMVLRQERLMPVAYAVSMALAGLLVFDQATAVLRYGVSEATVAMATYLIGTSMGMVIAALFADNTAQRETR